MHCVKGSDLPLTEVSENSLSWDQQVPESSSENTFHFHHICCTFLRTSVFRGLYYISDKNTADLSLHHSTETRSDQAWVRRTVPTATATDCNGSFTAYLRRRYLHFRHTEVNRISPTWVIPTKLIPLAPEVLEESGNSKVLEGLGANLFCPYGAYRLTRKQKTELKADKWKEKNINEIPRNRE